MTTRVAGLSGLCIALALFGCADSNAAKHHGNINNGTLPQAGSMGSSGDGGPGNFGNGSGDAHTMMQMMQMNSVDAGGNGKTDSVTPINIDNCTPPNAAGLDMAQTQKLMAGSGNPGSLKMLYPYDGAVFPRGMIAPMWMWDGGGDAVYLHIKSKAFEYKGCLKPTAAGQLQLPQDIWEKATARTYGPSDPYSVELSVLTGGNASGPLNQKITIAQATIKGSIYYNSYSSKLASGGGIGPGGNGAVLRISGVKSAEVFLGAGGCNACHSVSANGSRLISLPLGAGILGPANSASYMLTPQGAVNPMPTVATLANAAFPGISPDGSLFITSAHQGAVGPRPGAPTTTGGPNADLVETDTGTIVANTGIPTGAMTPIFSPDATQLAFTDYAINMGHGLAVMAFDPMKRMASGYRKVFEVADKYAAWPFFLPDSKGLVFAIGSSADFSGNGAGLMMGGPAAAAPESDLHILDLDGTSSKILAKAMGFASEADAASGKTYLPFGAEELHHHYYPTVAPVAAGGYFWVFFDSIRHYGNLGLQRQIWGAAVDIAANGDYTMDRSHPAFYLAGQEVGTGNHRAFAALDPCKKDGDSCTTGIDCCGGFCYVPEAMSTEFGQELKGSCNKPKEHTCSKRDERCTTTADCCPPVGTDPPNSCIGGFCAYVVPQ